MIAGQEENRDFLVYQISNAPSNVPKWMETDFARAQGGLPLGRFAAWQQGHKEAMMFGTEGELKLSTRPRCAGEDGSEIGRVQSR